MTNEFLEDDEMANSWFRSWNGAPTDQKWLVIGKRAGVAPGVVSAIAWALMDHAAQDEDPGSVARFDVETYSVFSGFEEAQIEAVLKAMRDKGFIGSDDRLSSWDKRQPKREDGSAERAKAWRERNRTQPNATERKRTQTNSTEKNRTE